MRAILQNVGHFVRGLQPAVGRRIVDRCSLLFGGQNVFSRRVRVRNANASGAAPSSHRSPDRPTLNQLFYVSMCLLTLVATATSNAAAAEPLLELNVGENSYQGKIAARNKHLCWLLDRDGSLNVVQLAKVDSFNKMSPRYRPYSFADIRGRVLEDYASEGYEAVTTRHYIVCAKKGHAKKYADVFEEVYRTFHVHFSVRGFKVNEPEFPLVALVFPDQKHFVEYCRQDGVNAGQGLLGYYLRSSNRVALYDTGKESLTAINNSTNPLTNQAPWLPAQDSADPWQFTQLLANVQPLGTLQGGLRDTVVHEATHQIAFNTGLHSRIGESPKWVVEGLATVFEAPGIRDTSSSRAISARLNRERFVWFGNYAKERRQPKSLEAFLAGDKLFSSSALDAYSQAWALTFYLIETRPREYAKYLRDMAQRNPMLSYTAEARVADFKSAFGDNLNLFEASFLRYIERIR